MTIDGCDPRQTELADKLEEVTRRLRQIEAAIDSLPVGFVLFDAEDRLVIKNRKNCLFDDKGVLEQPGTKFVDWLRFSLRVEKYGNRDRDTDSWIRQRVEQHRTEDNKLIQKLADGRSIQIEEKKSSDGSVVGTYTDVTDIVIIDEELKLVKDLAETANRAKSDFLANMSHELRTPLNAIIGFSDLMRKEIFGALGVDRYKGYLDDIWGSAGHLLEIINDILDIARVESGKYVLEISDFSLNEPCLSV